MKHSFLKKTLSALLSLTLLTGTAAGMGTATAAPAAGQSAISAEQFESPDMQYRPGTRWWVSLGTTKEDLVNQVNYLADNGFGMVEFVVFNSGYITGGANGPMAATSADNTLYPDPALYDYETDNFYEKLEAVVATAQERGITVDLNMGSGYEANSIFVTEEDSMEQMALGRTTLTVDADAVGAEQSFTIPDAEISPLYTTYANGVPRALWTGIKDINAIIISKIVSKEGTELTRGNEFVDLENETISKSYSNQYVLDSENTVTIDLNGQDIQAGDTIQWTPEEEGEWEVAVLYSVPSGSTPIRGFYDEDCVSLVTDHMDAEAVERYVNDYFGPNNERMNKIVTKYSDTIRAAFNDSYEFYIDQYYNYKAYEMAKDAENNPAGYDLSMYLPTLYKLSESCFGIGGTSADWVQYSSTPDTFLTYDLTDDEKDRIKYDYNTIVNELFMEGQAAFSDTLEQYDMVYRQQAYNPPIDTLRSAKNVDIPETEGLSEYSLKRVASGAHLYGRNLVTSEVFTLGSTPYNCTPTFIKNGYDLMATSGVNNFFYHGLSSTYYGTEEAKANNAYGEYGWRGWPTIGIEIGQVNPLWPYFNSLNTYASRLNYLMQQGQHSADIAVYMPLFGSLSETDAVKAMNYNGYTWDAINDDCIQNEISYVDGQLVLNSGLTFDALVLQNQPTTTAETLDALRALAEQGAPIIFYGDLPNKQGGYADGNYEAKDAEIAEKAAALLADFDNVYQVSSMDDYAALLDEIVDAPISYEYNENIRFDRRVLSTGGELAYIRNLSASDYTTVTLHVDETLANCYYLDQNDGSIYNAQKNADGTITITLQPNNAIGLLCEPNGVAMDADDVSAGIPDSLDTAEAAETVELNDFTLTVTADNIGTCEKKAEKETVTFTGDVLGNWIDDDFQNGALKYVSDVGVYETTFEIEDIAYYFNKKLELDLGEAYTAATVYVNDVNLGQVMYKPYTVDITPALVEGTNTLRIELQPLAYNRRGGFSQAYRETGEQQYAYYNEYIGTVSTYANTGIEGPITLNTYLSENPVISATAPETAQVNSDFVVSVTVDSSVSDVKLFNENDLALGRKDVVITDNQDGTKTFDITVSVGTVGNGRTFKIVTLGKEGYLIDSGVSVSLDITSIPAALTAFDLPDETVANRTFIVTATTDLTATKIEIFNENGMKMGIKSLSSEVVDGQKVWTGVMSIGTQGERTFSACAVNKYGARSEALTDNISVKAFA